MSTAIEYKRVIKFAKVGSAYLAKNKDSKTKLVESIKNVLRKIHKDEILQGCDELINENSLTLCSVDANGNILKDEKGGLMFTPENQLQLNKKNKETFNLTVDIHTIILQENNLEIKNLDESEVEAFSGIVINEISE